MLARESIPGRRMLLQRLWTIGNRAYPWSPFDGWNLRGWPVTTIVNGNIIFMNGKINNIRAREVTYDD